MATVVVSVNADAGGGFDAANVIIGVDVKFEKGFNWRFRDTFPALLMTPAHHSLQN